MQYAAISFTDSDIGEHFSGDEKVGKPGADLQRACRPYCLGVSASGQIQRIAGVLTLARADKRALLGQVSQVAGRGCG